MSNEQDPLSVTYERVRKVFGETEVAPQMRLALQRLSDSAVKQNAPDPVPEIEIEGIKELVTECGWNPAFNEISRVVANPDDRDPNAEPNDR